MAALTTVLIILQMVGLAMLERSHALPLAASLAASNAAARCTEQADMASPHVPYD